jgi:MFS family permease
MGSTIKSIMLLLLSAGIVLGGNALEGVLLPLRADIEGFTRLQIGLITSSYYGGLMIGCLVCPWAIARAGHIRAFAVFTSIATIGPLVEPVWPVPAVWWVVRGVTGLSFAGILTVFESWLNGVATNQTRGRVLSIYTVTNFSVIVIGQQLINVGDPKNFELFSLSAFMFSLATVPLALTAGAAPSIPRRPKLRLFWLTGVSPASVVGCAGAGLANGAFYALAPLYAKDMGLPVSLTAFFVTCAILGGALAQWPLGKLSDRFDRRLVMIFLTGIASISGLALFLPGAQIGLSLPSQLPAVLMFLLALTFGACALPIYWITLAHANDHVKPEQSVDVSSNLLFIFAIMAVAGPVCASIFMNENGAPGLFLWTAGVHVAVTLLIMLCMLIRRPTSPGKRDPYVSMPKEFTPAVYALDPRTRRKQPELLEAE